MSRVQLCSAAANDFTESLCWYAKQIAELALEFETAFDAALGRIAERSEQFPAFDERHRYLQMRRFPFLIVFRNLPGRIIVIAVAHTSRSPEFWLDR